MSESIEAAKKKVSELIESQVFPFIKKKTSEIRTSLETKVGPAMISIANNDEICLIAFEKMYEILPTPVRLIIKHDIFTSYCLANRVKVLSLIGVNAE